MKRILMLDDGQYKANNSLKCAYVMVMSYILRILRYIRYWIILVIEVLYIEIYIIYTADKDYIILGQSHTPRP